MCGKLEARALAPNAAKFARLTAFLVFLCFAECAAGSCISYGHSCWGGHGKRNDGGPKMAMKNDLTPNDFPSDTRWFLSRLLQGADSRLQKERDALLLNPKLILKDLNEEDDSKNIEDVEADYQESLQLIDAMFPDGQKIHPRFQNDKVRMIKFLKNNPGRLN